MFFKVLTFVAFVFVFGVSIVLGLQVKGLSDQIGTKDSVSFLNLNSTINDTDLDPSMLKSIKKVEVNGVTVNVEVAATADERQKGLMHRDSLGANSGMLFIFERSAIYPFWMKNTKIPLDIIWISSDKKIADIRKYVQPCVKEPCSVSTPSASALYVLEVNAGWTDRTSTDIGDSVLFFN